MQQQQLQSSYRLDSHSSYNSGRSSTNNNNDGDSNAYYNNNNPNGGDDIPSNFDRKTSTTSSVSSSTSQQPKQGYNLAESEENKVRSSKMSFGKQSHMLNPIDGRRRNKNIIRN
ncbi:hypothetical protein INT46_006353, partial [Mucor plumbeus]